MAEVDGATVLYHANNYLWLRPVGQLQVTQMPDTENATEPFFSPNGDRIGFFADGQLKQVSVTGGPAITLTDAPEEAAGATWGEDGAIRYAQYGGIMKVSDAGGTPELLVAADGEVLYGPQILPGGEWVLLVLISGGRDGRYLPTGHIVYCRNSALFAVPFDGVGAGPAPAFGVVDRN